MSYFVRMVSSGKWLKYVGIDDIKNISADVVTSDLRTTDGTLSLWKVESLSEDSLNEAILALASSRNSLTRLDIVVIEEDKLLEFGLQYENKPDTARTAYASMTENHYDLNNLTYENLGQFGSCILTNINNSVFFKKINKRLITDLLVEKYSAEELDLDKLDTSLREKIMDNIKTA